MLRICSWNLNGRALWDQLAAADIDLALVQEAPLPPATWPRTVVPPPADGWTTFGWKWPRRTGIIQVSDRIELTDRQLAQVGDLDATGVPVSRAGTLTVADVNFGGETVTLASVYGGWERSADPPRMIYADAAAHRLLSDLSALLTHPGHHRLIVAGDLNILHGYGEGGNAYWAARYASVFQRAEALGLTFIGPQAPNGRTAEPRPTELPDDSRDVPTYHTSQQGPEGAMRQLDFVFASDSIADRVHVRALNHLDEWGPSDHCRLAIELHT